MVTFKSSHSKCILEFRNFSKMIAKILKKWKPSSHSVLVIFLIFFFELTNSTRKDINIIILIYSNVTNNFN